MTVASRLRFGETARPAWLRYGVALAATAPALGLSLVLEPWTAGRLPFLLFVVSVVIAAWYGGIGPGLAATVLSVAAAEVLLLAPGRDFAVHGGPDLVALGIFAAVALLVSWISGRTRLALHALRQRSAELELRQAEAEAAVARLGLLERVARTLTSSLDDQRSLHDLARLCVDSFADYCVTYLLEDGRLRRVGLAHGDPDHEPLVRRLLELAPPEPGTPGAGAVVASGEAVLAHDISAEALRASAQDAAHLAVLERLGPRSSMVLPLIARGRTVGAIAFATTDRSGRRYDDHDLRLAREIAAHAALAVDNARLYEQSRRELGHRRATEGALRRRESEVRALVEHAPDLMVRLDRDLRYLYINPAVERQLGRDKREFLGKTLAEARHYAPAELVEVWERTIHEVLATGEPTTAEFSLPTPAGPRFLHTRVVPEHGEDGEIETVLSLARDITDRRVAEERQAVLVEAGRLATSSLDAATLVESLTDLAARRVADWCVLYVLADSGAEIERVALAAADPVSHARGEEFLRRHPLQLDRRDLPLVRALVDGVETLLPRLDDEPPPGTSGEHLAALLRLGVRSAMVVPLPARGRVIGAMAFATAGRGRRFGADDLALARELATQAALALDNARLYGELGQAVRLRDDILAIVAHDLRNPLYVISSLVAAFEAAGEAAAGGGRAAAFDPRRAADAIRRAIARADRLIQDLLDISRIEAGRLSVTPAPVDVPALVAEVCETAQARSAEKGLRVESAVVPGCPRLTADRARVVQALGNLLDNALEHSPEGARVTVRAALGAGGAEVELAVADEGPGIREEDLPHLFDRFWQGGRAVRGTGLGLAIVKGIAEAHGGRVAVASRPGQGSTFRIVLPAEAAEAAEADAEPDAAAAG